MDRNEVREIVAEEIEDRTVHRYEQCPVCKAHTTCVRVLFDPDDDDEGIRGRRGIRCLWCNSLFEVKKELVRVE